VLTLSACGQSPAPPAQQPATSPAPTPASRRSTSPADSRSQREAASPSQSSSGAANPFDALLGRRAGGSRPLPAGLLIGGDCPAVGSDADQEIAAQKSGRVPLEEGLTLTDVWEPNAKQDFECLTQVTKVDREGIDISVGCTPDRPKMPKLVKRRICRSDLRGAHMLHTGLGGIVIESAEGELPETIVGATEFSLSMDQFAELKRTGVTRNHYVQRNSVETLEGEAEGLLRNEGTGTRSILVNDRSVDVPVVRATGDTDFWFQGRSMKARVTAAILDDDRFPMLIDYRMTTDAMPDGVFRINFAKITHPDGGDMERALADNKPVDVYGIYFDFASDRIRAESEPVLKEIAGVLARNPEWKMSIAGHTDSIGGTASNLQLSQRRSAAVRKALVERYHIAADRLTTTGYGQSAPKDTNETPEGRARNRRVELMRQQ
jgi:outer membrane protein OmpA-like peptidoglycan-associated protein